MPLSKAQQQRRELIRLRAENDRLREYIQLHHSAEHRMLYELVDLKARLELVRAAIEDDPYAPE
jgi:hypothetical protein